jgi:hypothetical protein
MRILRNACTLLVERPEGRHLGTSVKGVSIILTEGWVKVRNFFSTWPAVSHTFMMWIEKQCIRSRNCVLA